MADLPGEAYIHRYNELVKKLTGAKGGEPMHELAAELLPVIILEQERPEFAIYKGELLWFQQITRGASVGNFSHIGVRNPASSGLIVTLEQFSINTAALVDVAVFAHAPVQPGATVALTIQRDFRAKGTPGAVVISFVNATLVGAQCGELEVPPGMVPVSLPVVLGENNEILFAPTGQNAPIQGWFIGRERPFETSERA